MRDNYEITCFDPQGKKCADQFSARDDDDDNEAKMTYRNQRLGNPQYRDWRLWALEESGKKRLVAANEG